jgi:hypothetical protein
MPAKGIFILFIAALIMLTATLVACATQTDSPAPVMTSQGSLAVPTLAPTSAVISTRQPEKLNSTAIPPTTTPPLITLDSSPASAYQQMVDSLRALATGIPIPASFKPGTSSNLDYLRPAEAFDVNIYFTVLNHLSMQPGYVLDYIYHDASLGAQPYIYARKSNDQPFKSLTELEDTTKKQAGPGYDQNELYYTYLEQIRVDGTPEGFFQFIALRITGDQFYLFWHANLNDRKIICDHEALDKTISSLRGFWGISDEKLYDLQKQSANLDLEPKIEIGDNTVRVKIVTFTKWGGLIQREYSITRQFPHRVIDSKTATLIPFDCGLRF